MVKWIVSVVRLHPWHGATEHFLHWYSLCVDSLRCIWRLGGEVSDTAQFMDQPAIRTGALYLFQTSVHDRHCRCMACCICLSCHMNQQLQESTRQLSCSSVCIGYSRDYGKGENR